MTDRCMYLSEEKDRGICECAITRSFCVAAMDLEGKVSKSGYYSNKNAEFCPAYNLKGDLTEDLQREHFERQRLRLEGKFKQPSTSAKNSK